MIFGPNPFQRAVCLLSTQPALASGLVGSAPLLLSVVDKEERTTLGRIGLLLVVPGDDDGEDRTKNEEAKGGRGEEE